MSQSGHSLSGSLVCPLCAIIVRVKMTYTRIGSSIFCDTVVCGLSFVLGAESCILMPPIMEGALGNIPVIAFCDTDSPMSHVDIGIPANNKVKHNIGALFWLLARMVLQMRGTITPAQPWDVMVQICGD